MHIWGPIVLHPATYAVADQFNAALSMGVRYVLVAYNTSIKPTVEDIQFLLEHL